MRIHIQLFAFMLEESGSGALDLELSDVGTVGDAVRVLRERRPNMCWPQGTMVAVNRQYCAHEMQLKDGDELAIIPPVSGG